MSNKLAKKLRDAGFGNYTNNVIDEDTGCRFTDVWMPTLSELIEKCGDKFKSLHKESRLANNKWIVASRGFPTMAMSFCCNGDTPEEAVAKLWLKLNK